MATDKELLKVKRPKYVYTIEQAIAEHLKLAHLVSSKEVVVDELFYSEVLIALGKIGHTDFKGLYLKNKGLANDSAVGVPK